MLKTHQILAQKYRPKILRDLIGQDVLQEALNQAIKNNKLPHAFLLHGIRGVGKTTTARIIARTLNCLNKNKILEPCGNCHSCKSIDEDKHLDVIEMDAASRTSVENIREIIESARYKAVISPYKIFIIDEVHMLSKSAFNALLKTLEEPPAHVIFIFATTEIRKIPDTIISRCMRFDLKRIDAEIMTEYLNSIADKESLEIETEACRTLVRAAEGSMRDGVSLLDQAIVLTLGEENPTVIKNITVNKMLGRSDGQKIFQLVKSIFEGHIETTLEKTRELIKIGEDPLSIAQNIMDLIYWLTCLKTSSLNQRDLTYSKAEYEQGTKIIENLNISYLLRTWQILMQGYEEIIQSPFPNQSLEMTLIKICYTSDMPDLKKIIENINKEQNFNSAPINQPNINTSLSPKHFSALPNEKNSENNDLETRDSQKYFDNNLRGEKTENNTLPQTFEEMVKIIEKAREPLLFSHLIHDVHIIDYKPKTIKMRLGSQTPSWFAAKLNSILLQATGEKWDLIISEKGGEESLNEKRQQLQQNLEKEALNHPKTKELLKQFPGSQIEVIN